MIGYVYSENYSANNDEFIKLCNCFHKTVHINNYIDIKILDWNTPIIFKVLNRLSKNEFIKAMSTFFFDWSKDGISNKPLGKINYRDFLIELDSCALSDKYVFDINRKLTEQVVKIKELIPCPDVHFINTREPKVVIYTGGINTCTGLHTHDESLNYLIHGKKLWIIFSDSKENQKYVNKEGYMNFVRNCKTRDWLKKDFVNLKKNLTDLYIFTQVSGDVVYIPSNYYHAVINLKNSYGFTYNGKI